MGGDLEDAVGGGVDDGPAGPNVLGPELGDDLRARGGLVAQNALDAGPVFERGDELGRKAPGEEGERLVQDEAHELPVPVQGVFAAGPLGHAAPGGQRRRDRGDAREGHDVPQAELSEKGQAQAAAALGDVDQRVGPLVAKVGGVGQAADADGIQDDQDGAVDRSTRHLISSFWA